MEALINPNNVTIEITVRTIDNRHLVNLCDLDKIFDVVSCLRDFSSNPIEFNSWRKSVERILHLYEPTKSRLNTTVTLAS